MNATVKYKQISSAMWLGNPWSAAKVFSLHSRLSIEHSVVEIGRVSLVFVAIEIGSLFVALFLLLLTLAVFMPERSLAELAS